jgi:hypothetical protein
MGDDQAQSKEERRDFFISYTSADHRWAEWIAWHLEEAGYSTMLQAWDFHAGGNFVVDMDTTTRQTERTIAVLSPDYFARQTRIRAQAAGAVAFVEKRGTTDTLLAAIRQAAGQAGKSLE